MRKLLFGLVCALAVCGCNIIHYSFSGTSIQPDVKTITLNEFEYKALKVNPTLSNSLSEAVRTRFRQMTRLEQVEMDGDMEISGDAGAAALAATAINPVLGLSAFLAQLVLQKPLAHATTRQFAIEGTWKEPRVTPIPTAPGQENTP